MQRSVRARVGTKRSKLWPTRSLTQASATIGVVLALVLLIASCGSASLPNGGGAADIPEEEGLVGVPEDDHGAPSGPSPVLAWASADVGPVPLEGRVAIDDSGAELVVTASGFDISGHEDSFHFAYVRLSGDIDIVARVDALDYTDDWAKAGVMLRQSLEAGSVHTMMAMSPLGSGYFVQRTTHGGFATIDVVEDLQLPSWVRLTRTGTTVTGLVSRDGANWSEAGSVELELSGALYVGIGVTSTNPGTSTQAEVRGVSVAGSSAPEPTPESEPTPTPPPSAVVEPGPSAAQWVCPTTPLSPAFEPTYFVSADGNDGNDGRTASTPFRTLQRAANAVNAGDVVWVRGGVYPSNVEFRSSGTPSAPIVVESYPGECAIFDGSGLGTWDRLTLEGVSNMILRNVVLRNSRSEGLLLSRSHSNVISNVRTYGNHLSGITNIHGNDNLFTRVIMHDNNGRVDDADGISISSGNGNRIDRCIAFRNSDDGVDTWLSTNTIVERCIAFHNGVGGGDGNGFKAGGQGATVNTVVRYSIAFANYANGFDNNTGRNVRFDHNTAYANHGTGFFGSFSTVRNNLAIANGVPWAGIDSSQSHNSWNLGISSHQVLSTSWTHADFLSLRPSSEAIDAGADIGLPYTGSAPDLGALPLGQSIASFIGASLGALPEH